MIQTRKSYDFNGDAPVSVAQVLRSEHADNFMAALNLEIERLLSMGTYEEFLGDISTIDRGRLLSSKCIFDIKYEPDGTFD